MAGFECCRDCTTERHVGCHGTCKRYISAKEKHDKKQAEIRKKKTDEWMVVGYEIDAVTRMKKSHKFVCNKK